MALIACPECGGQVSTSAATCPACGYPIQAVTIEATGKKWKSMQLAGGLIMAVGVFGIVGSCLASMHRSEPTAGLPIAATVVALGLVLVAGGRLGAWWHHR